MTQCSDLIWFEYTCQSVPNKNLLQKVKNPVVWRLRIVWILKSFLRCILQTRVPLADFKSCIEIGVCLYGNTLFPNFISWILEQINERTAISDNKYSSRDAHTLWAGQGPSEPAQIKSKIYNVLNIIKLDSPPLGLGTRLEERWTRGRCPRSHKLIVLKLSNICTDIFNE